MTINELKLEAFAAKPISHARSFIYIFCLNTDKSSIGFFLFGVTKAGPAMRQPSKRGKWQKKILFICPAGSLATLRDRGRGGGYSVRWTSSTVILPDQTGAASYSLKLAESFFKKTKHSQDLNLLP